VELFLCPIDPIRCAVDKMLSRWAEQPLSPKSIFARTQFGLKSLPSTELQQAVDSFPIGQFTQTRFILAGRDSGYTALPDAMTWNVASELVTTAATEGRVELTSWGYHEARCVMIYGDRQTAEGTGLPLQDWSIRPVSFSNTLVSSIGSVGGWDADASALAALFAELPGTKALVVFAGSIARTEELLGTSSGSARGTILESHRHVGHPLPPDIATVVFHDLSNEELLRILLDGQADSSYRFTICPASESRPITDDDALKILLYDSNDYVADRALSRFRWFVPVNSHDDSAFWLSLHALPQDSGLIGLRQELVDLFSRDKCIVW